MARTLRKSHHSGKKTKNGRIHHPTGSSPRATTSKFKRASSYLSYTSGQGKIASLSTVKSQSSQSSDMSTDDDPEDAIKMGWLLVNECFENDPEEADDPTLQTLVRVLRAVDNEAAADKYRRHQESQQQQCSYPGSNLSGSQGNVITFAAMERRQSLIDGKLADMQSQLATLTSVAFSLETAISGIQSQLATPTPAETSYASIEDRIAEMQTEMVTTATFARICQGNSTSLSEMQGQLAQISEKLSFMPKMAAQVEPIPQMQCLMMTLKSCIRAIAKQLRMPEVEDSLSKPSPQGRSTVGQVAPGQQTPGRLAAGSTRPEQLATVQAHVPQARTPAPRASFRARQPKPVPAKQNTNDKSRGAQHGGRIDRYVLRTVQ